MAEVQTVYTDSFAIGYKGFVPSGELQNRISRTIEDAAGIGFGVAAYRGADDHTCTATQTLSGSSAALGTNTGNGVMGAITVTPGAKIGNYVLTIVEPGSNVGTFIVVDPDGKQIGDGAVASAFSAGGIAFTLADGATDFVAGDSFTITIAGNKLLGFTIAHQCLGILSGQTVDKYQQYDNVAIMPRGPICVEAGGSVTDGAPAFIDTDGNLVASSGVPTGGWEFDTTGSDGDIVRLVKR